MPEETQEQSPMVTLLNIYTRLRRPVQLRFKADHVGHGGPLGPGMLSHVEVALGSPCARGLDGLFTFSMPVMMGSRDVAREVTLPITFHADDVLWVSEGPQVDDDAPIKVENRIIAP